MKCDYSRDICRKSGSNFYYSFFFLPPAKREGMSALYAFSRLVDDAVDEASSIEQGQERIHYWRERLSLIYHEDLSKITKTHPLYHPILPELAWTVKEYMMPQKYFEDLLIGMEMDLTQDRYKTFNDLEQYCYHVAGTIGLLCQCLFGVRSEEAKIYAVLLGTAFQVTNIIRDVGVDATIGRIYLPQEDLERFSVKESDILAQKMTPELKKLLSYEAERADYFYQEAERKVLPHWKASIFPAEIMKAFYWEILKQLRVEDFPVFEKKMKLKTSKKFSLLFKTWCSSLCLCPTQKKKS